MLTLRASTLWLGMLALAIFSPALRGQEKDPRVTQPVKPLPGIVAGESSSKAPAEAAAVPAVPAAKRDSRPLSGAEEIGLGGGGTSQLLTAFQVLQSVDTNGGSVPGQSQAKALTSVRGTVSLQRIWSTRQLSLQYSGGGSLYNTETQNNGPYHQFGFSQQFTFQRWTMLVSDFMSYSTNSTFGGGGAIGGSFGGLGGLGGGIGGGLGGGGFGGQGTGLNSGLLPSQTIFTSHSGRISNSVVGQAQYNFSARSSVTGTASYGLLHFLDSGFIDTRSFAFQSGWNREITARDTIALSYGLNLIRFQGSNGEVNNHTVHFNYARRITGRMALRLAAGPQINLTDSPVNGSATRLSWSTQTQLTYRFRRSDLDLSYNRRLTGGSGVLLGANSDLVRVGVNRRLGRSWETGVGLGFAHNRNLRELTTGLAERKFNTVQADFSVRRPVGRSANVYFLYNLQWQKSDSSPCVTAPCTSRLTRHHFGIGFDFQMRPIQLD